MHKFHVQLYKILAHNDTCMKHVQARNIQATVASWVKTRNLS